MVCLSGVYGLYVVWFRVGIGVACSNVWVCLCCVNG